MLNQKQIDKLIVTIRTSAAKLRENVQEAACAVTVHAVLHGDVTLATRLTDALGAGGRRQALVSWLEEFGPFAYDRKNETYKLAPRKLDKMLGEFDGSRERCAEALEIYLGTVPTWFDFVKEQVKSAYDAEKQINAVISAITSKASKGEDVKGAGLVPFLQQALVAYHRAELLKDADVMALLQQGHMLATPPAATEVIGEPPVKAELKEAA
jgi:hypothetical protein